MRKIRLRSCALLALSTFLGASSAPSNQARANPAIVIDAQSGETLFQQDATKPWYPASLTKLMTAFVALKAVREKRVSLQTPIAVSRRATRMAPSKMGFRAGTLVTLDNALKMLMVKSANDIAVVIAEGVSGSVEAFAEEMNASAAAIGMRESHFVNPNGLPDSRQVSSARDMAVLGRALYVYFPEHAGLFGIGALKLGNQIIPTHNGMLGRYPGADGMKTGFTCSAGFNLVASATQNGRRLIVTVLGAPSATTRTIQAASLLDKVFGGRGSNYGPALSLASSGGAAPDMRDDICHHRGKSIEAFSAEIEDISSPLPSIFSFTRNAEGAASFNPPAGAVAPLSPARQIATLPRPTFEPTPVFIGPAEGWTGPVLRAAAEAGGGRKQAYANQKETSGDTPLAPTADSVPMHGRKAKGKTKEKAKTTLAAHPVADEEAEKPASTKNQAYSKKEKAAKTGKKEKNRAPETKRKEKSRKSSVAKTAGKSKGKKVNNAEAPEPIADAPEDAVEETQ